MPDPADTTRRPDGRAAKANRSKPAAGYDLFDPPPGLAEAEAARDEALDRVEANAPDGWIEAALAWLRVHLEANPEYVPDVSNRLGPQPPERRAWGVVTRRAIRQGWIERTGYAPRTCGHSTPGPVYRSLLWGGAGGREPARSKA